MWCEGSLRLLPGLKDVEAAHLAMHQDAGLPLVLAIAAADAHESAGALPAAEAPPRHLCPLALQRGLDLHCMLRLWHSTKRRLPNG